MKKNYDILDLTKIILSLMVVAIHTGLFPEILYPWLRLAVPLFFIISAYLLFKKLNTLPTEKHGGVIKRYISRMLLLYLFWFIVLLPITIKVRSAWFSDGILMGVVNTLTKPLLDSTFIASWYLMASIIGTPIVYYLSKRYKTKTLLIIFTLSHIACCYFSSYRSILPGAQTASTISSFIEPQFSFLVSFIYIYIGKLFADRKIQLKRRNSLIAIPTSCLLLYAEWFIIRRLTGAYNNDCYLMLVPTALFIFSFIKDITIHLKHSKILRQLANFVYPLHGSIAYIISWKLSGYIAPGLPKFLTVIICCMVAFTVVKLLEKRIKILKYSY